VIASRWQAAAALAIAVVALIVGLVLSRGAADEPHDSIERFDLFRSLRRAEAGAPRRTWSYENLETD